MMCTAPASSSLSQSHSWLSRTSYSVQDGESDWNDRVARFPGEASKSREYGEQMGRAVDAILNQNRGGEQLSQEKMAGAGAGAGLGGYTR